MNKSIMSVKSMIETYVNFELSDETWNMFYEMANHHLISDETWNTFFMKCKSWVLSDDGDAIIDYETNTNRKDYCLYNRYKHWKTTYLNVGTACKKRYHKCSHKW